MNEFELLIIIPLFVILLIAIHKPVKEAFKFNDTVSWIFSGCVSALSMIGIKQSFKGSLGAILLPYAAMGICIMAILLWKCIAKPRKKEHLTDNPEKRDLESGRKLKR